MSLNTKPEVSKEKAKSIKSFGNHVSSGKAKFFSDLGRDMVIYDVFGQSQEKKQIFSPVESGIGHFGAESRHGNSLGP